MAISDSTIYSSLWLEIKTVLTNASIVTTNSSTSATTPATITGTYPDVVGTRPTIVINTVELDEDTWKFGSREGLKTMNVVIDCYANKVLYSTQLIEQVVAALKTEKILGVMLSGITSNSSFEPVNDSNKIYATSATFTFIRE